MNEKLEKYILNKKYGVQKNLKELLIKDPDFAEEVFLYEMNNYEYAINMTGDVEVMMELNLTMNDISETPSLLRAWKRARSRHYNEMHEKSII